MTKEPNVVFRANINTNDMNGTTGVKEAAKAIRDALAEFENIAKHRDREAKMVGLKTKKARKANTVEIEITFFCMRPTFLRLHEANKKFSGYGRWA